ncbi:GNAT superfamily N-acetyltransferase [Nakamurella sp. UYEF19]|uniref:GNAT family N-acetyltransferase n=1 Tax=Nakamurella sp. UYEF19 TaxID=1756392 RepID=UPI00339B4A4F
MSARVDAPAPERSLEVRPVTPDRWDDLVSVFGQRGDDPGWCWCRMFLGPAADTSGSLGTTPDNREALRQEVTAAATPPGLIAYVDGRPAGWSRVGPRDGFPRVRANRALARVLADDPGAWWVTCFAIESGHRRTGVAAALLEAAVAFARDHGATSVEGHPVDVAALKATRVSGSALFIGTMATFVAAGFSEVGRTFSSRPVMRLVL